MRGMISIRNLGWIGALNLAIGLSCCLSAAAQESSSTSCSDAPLVISLSDFRMECRKFANVHVDPATHQAQIDQLTKEYGPQAPFVFDGWTPPDADIFIVTLVADKNGAPQKEMQISFATAHAGYGLKTIILRNANPQLEEGLQLFGMQRSVYWQESHKVMDYDVQAYRVTYQKVTQGVAGVSLPSEACFGFARYIGQLDDGEYRRRLMGRYCEPQDDFLDDAAVERVLGTISLQ